MSAYAHTLKYAGPDPYEPEHNRSDIPWDEMEILEQDEDYQRLAEARYLARQAAEDVGHEDVPKQSKEFVGVAADYLDGAVTEYVDAWLAHHRDTEGSA